MRLTYLAVTAIGALCAPLIMYGDDDLTVNIVGDGSEIAQFNTSTISRITFPDNGMSILTTDGLQKFSFEEFDTMTFDFRRESGLDIPASSLDNNLTISVADNLISVSGDADIEMEVFDLQGNLLNRISGHQIINHDVSVYAKGIYIALINNKAVKFIR